MALVVEKTSSGRDCKVYDLSQADFSRLEIEHAEAEMPGLTTCRAEFNPHAPLKGARITGCSHLTIHMAALIKTLTELGAKVRWCSTNTLSAQDHAAASIARDSAFIFIRKGKTPQDYWQCIERALDWGPDGGPDLIIDDGADATLFIHEAVKAEEIFAKTGQLPEPSSAENAESQIVPNLIRDWLKTDPMRYHKMKKGLAGVSVGTTSGVGRLLGMQANRSLSFPAININDSVTKSKVRNLLGSRYSVLDGIKRATNNMMISEKKAIVCGYDHEASEGCSIALKKAGANVFVYEVDPKHGLRARLRGFPVIKTLSDDVSTADIFVASFNKGNKIDVFNHLKAMKNNVIIYCMDPILDQNSNMYAGIEQYFSDMRCVDVDPQTDKWVSLETNSSIIVLRNEGYPSLMSSWSCTMHVVALLELWSKRGTGKYEDEVYDVPEHLEEKVSDLHLAELMKKMTKEETNRQAGDRVSVTNRSDKKRTLAMAVQACWVVMLALGVMKASKGGTDIPFSAIWND